MVKEDDGRGKIGNIKGLKGEDGKREFRI